MNKNDGFLGNPPICIAYFVIKYIEKIILEQLIYTFLQVACCAESTDGLRLRLRVWVREK